MNKAYILLALLAVVLVAGCTSTKAPATTIAPADTSAPVETLPTVTDITEEELPTEPDFELNDTVDLGSLL